MALVNECLDILKRDDVKRELKLLFKPVIEILLFEILLFEILFSKLLFSKLLYLLKYSNIY